MALSILNNIASLSAQNQLTSTNNSLKTTLNRLSSGSRINSGADDAAGLAIADGLKANITALTQSGRNANDGIGKLQVADGALAQVTSLLNRAVTLATEASSSTVSASQRGALDAEFTQIKSEITRIGTDTTFNGDRVFGVETMAAPSAQSLTTSTALQAGSFAVGALKTQYSSDTFATGSLTRATSAGGGTLTVNGASYTGSTVGDVIDAVNLKSSTTHISASLDMAGKLRLVSSKNEAFTVSGDASLVAVTGAAGGATATTNQTSITYTSAATQHVSDLITAINADSSFTNVSASLVNGNLTLVAQDGNGVLTATDTATSATSTSYTHKQVGGDTNVFLSDGATSSTLTTNIGKISASILGIQNLTLTDDATQTAGAAAQNALSSINSAVATIASQRGAIGAGINRLQSATTVMTNQTQNLSSAEDGIRSADIASEVANMTKFNILQSTGMTALSQSNQMAQSVLQLLR